MNFQKHKRSTSQSQNHKRTLSQHNRNRSASSTRMISSNTVHNNEQKKDKLKSINNSTNKTDEKLFRKKTKYEDELLDKVKFTEVQNVYDLKENLTQVKKEKEKYKITMLSPSSKRKLSTCKMKLKTQ